MMNKTIVCLVILIIACIIPVFYTYTHRERVHKVLICKKKHNIPLHKPGQNLIHNTLKFCTDKFPDQTIGDICLKKEYIYEILDEQKLIILRKYTDLAIQQLNNRCKQYASSLHVIPFHFRFIEFINAVVVVNKQGNTRWKIDIMVQETTLNIGYRLILDFTLDVHSVSDFDSTKSCKEFTDFPFPKYFIGYPTLDQLIPLPIEVLSTTGQGVVLSNKGKNPVHPYFKSLYLNSATIKNADHVLGTDIPSKNVSPGFDNNKLPFSKYPSRRFNPNDIQLPQNTINNDVRNKYTWKPKNKPKNTVRYKGNTETYQQSISQPSWFGGWIQPSEWRNKWPRLLSEPRDRFEWPSKPIGYFWNCLGLMKPVSTLSDKTHPGTRYSTHQTEQIPLDLPTNTGLPTNDGENHWLFDTLKGSDTTNVLSR